MGGCAAAGRRGGAPAGTLGDGSAGRPGGGAAGWDDGTRGGGPAEPSCLEIREAGLRQTERAGSGASCREIQRGVTAARPIERGA